jgi:hypothetical protein
MFPLIEKWITPASCVLEYLERFESKKWKCIWNGNQLHWNKWLSIPYSSIEIYRKDQMGVLKRIDKVYSFKHYLLQIQQTNQKRAFRLNIQFGDRNRISIWNCPLNVVIFILSNSFQTHFSAFKGNLSLFIKTLMHVHYFGENWSKK